MRLSHRVHLVQSSRSQSGATLIVGMIMLTVITLLVVNAFILGSSNIKSVGNMQVRQEVIAAANAVVEQKISSAFTNNPTAAAESINVDLNKDLTTDYVVAIAVPTCVRRIRVDPPAGTESGVETVTSGVALTDPTWNTDWDIAATVTDTASGAQVLVHEGVRVRLSNSQKSLVCP